MNWPFHRAVPRYDRADSLATINAMAEAEAALQPQTGIMNAVPQFVTGMTIVPGSWRPRAPSPASVPAVQPATTTAPETNHMAITFKSVGHFFATAYTAIKNDLVKVEGTEATVEKVTAEIPVYGPLALTVEKAAYAALGELSAVLNAGGAAAASKLNDAGLDSSVVSTIQALVAGVGNIATVAKAL